MWSFNRDDPSCYDYVDLFTSGNPNQKPLVTTPEFFLQR